MTRQFKVRDGRRIKGDVGKVGPQLWALRGKLGEGFNDENFIEVVQREQSRYPDLHSELTWDNKIAGHEWRRLEVRNLNRSVVVVEGRQNPKTKKVEEVVVDMLTHVPKEPSGRGYYDLMSAVVKDRDAFISALEELQTKMNGAIRAVEELHEAARSSGKKGKVALIRIVMKALNTAMTVVKKMAA